MGHIYVYNLMATIRVSPYTLTGEGPPKYNVQTSSILVIYVYNPMAIIVCLLLAGRDGRVPSRLYPEGLLTGEGHYPARYNAHTSNKRVIYVSNVMAVAIIISLSLQRRASTCPPTL